MSKQKINAKDFLKKIEKITKERMAQESVVSLSEYRELNKKKRSRNLLIIDDDESIRKALTRLFENQGYRVISAADGTQLSNVIEDQIIDLIILDIGLPWVNGFELAQLMKEHDEFKSIPLVFLSGRDSQIDIKRGFQIGADDYITKPFDNNVISRSVHTLLELQ